MQGFVFTTWWKHSPAEQIIPFLKSETFTVFIFQGMQNNRIPGWKWKYIYNQSNNPPWNTEKINFFISIKQLTLQSYGVERGNCSSFCETSHELVNASVLWLLLQHYREDSACFEYFFDRATSLKLFMNSIPDGQVLTLQIPCPLMMPWNSLCCSCVGILFLWLCEINACISKYI